jgi:epoxyqueuosine reductase QueG
MKGEKMALDSELTKAVKNFALECGVDMVGVASVDRFEGAPPGFHPTDVMGSTKSVITFARKFIMGVLDELAPGRQRLSYKHHMFAHKNTYNTFTGYDLARFLEDKGYRAFIIQPTTPYYAQEFRSVMSHRHAAIRCGLGVFGKNNLVLTKEFGPRQRFCTVLTDAQLVSDPMIDDDLCKGCNICREACPVQAWDPKSGIFYKPVCAHHQNWNRADQECKQPCGICIQACPVGKEALGLPLEQE